MVFFWKNAKELNDKAFSLADQGKYSEAREIFQKAGDKASEDQDELLKLYAFYGMTLCDVQMADEIPILFLLKNSCSMVEEKLNGMGEVSFFYRNGMPYSRRYNKESISKLANAFISLEIECVKKIAALQNTKK